MSDEELHQALAYAWVALLSLLGGAAGLLDKLARRKTAATVLNITAHLAMALLAGMVTSALAESAHLAPKLADALVAVSGGMGSEMIHRIEQNVRRLADRVLPDDEQK